MGHSLEKSCKKKTKKKNYQIRHKLQSGFTNSELFKYLLGILLTTSILKNVLAFNNENDGGR